MLLKSYAFIASSVLTLAFAASTPRRQQNKAVKLNFDVLRGDSTSDAGKNKQAKLVKRADGEESLELSNMRSYYQVDLSIGSKGDKCSVLIDTGSSDLWVMGSDIKCSASSLSSSSAAQGSHRRLISEEDLVALENLQEDESQNKKRERTAIKADFASDVASLLPHFATDFESQIAGLYATQGPATAPASVCTALGSFNTAGSDSFRVNSSAPSFAISYADGTYANGVWGQDSIDFKDFNVSDVSLAVVNDTSSNFGVLGIGLEGLETTFASSRSASRAYTYENLPVRMKSSGAINKVLYSLYLAEDTADKGSILFGAVDHAKYSGQLQTVPLVNIYPDNFRNPIRLDISLNSLTLQSNSQNISVTTSPIAALLDSGTTLTYLPTAILKSLADSLDATYSSSVGFYRVNCAYNTNSAYVVFNFSGAEIKVPLSDLIVTYGSSQCFLGVLEQSSDSSTSYPYAILGDNFIRSAYLVYNLEDYEISLAQAKYTSDEDIEVVSSSVPRASKASGYSSTSLATAADGSSSTELSSSGLKKSSGEHSIPFPKALASLAVGIGAMIAVL